MFYAKLFKFIFCIRYVFSTKNKAERREKEMNSQNDKVLNIHEAIDSLISPLTEGGKKCLKVRR